MKKAIVFALASMFAAPLAAKTLEEASLNQGTSGWAYVLMGAGASILVFLKYYR